RAATAATSPAAAPASAPATEPPPATKPPAPQVSTAAILEAYSRIQQSLNADRLTGIADAAQKIVAEATRIGDAAAPVRAAANVMQRASDLPAARTQMGTLSDAVIKLARANGGFGEMKSAYCPMMRKYWLQKGDTIQNPYYGQSMSDCGRFADPPK